MKKLAVSLAALGLSACVTTTERNGPQGQFLDRISALCGKAFEGRLVSQDPQDHDMAAQRLVMHVRECSADTVRIPFHVGDNRSRTWVITRTATGLRLKHDHRHEDGSEDKLTQYGGDTASEGTALRQEFPADQFSKEMFVRLGSAQSVPNVWAVEIAPGATFAYELRRPGRFFRVEFDLTRPVAPPPPPWGSR